MVVDMRTPKAKAKSKADYEKWSKELHLGEKRRTTLAKKIWGRLPWQPIVKCPFEDYEHKRIFVTDGKIRCLAIVKKRFGTPMRCIKEPVMAFTDDGPRFVGGKYAKIKAPAWWFKWEFEDEDGLMNYAGGHEVGKEEVGFIATHWLPMLP